MTFNQKVGTLEISSNAIIPTFKDCSPAGVLPIPGDVMFSVTVKTTGLPERKKTFQCKKVDNQNNSDCDPGIHCTYSMTCGDCNSKEDKLACFNCKKDRQQASRI